MRIIRWLPVVAAVLMAVGCIKVDQTLTLAKDGSGTLSIRYGMSEQALAQLEAMESMGKQLSEASADGAQMDPDTPFDFDFDETEIRESFEEEGLDGITLVSASSETVEGWKYMNLELAFDDLESLQKTDYFDEGLSLSKDAEGNYVLTQNSSDEPQSAADDEDSAMQAQMMQQMAPMFAGLRIENRVIVPTQIIETNAAEVDGNTAVWVYDIDEDPAVLAQLENLSMRVVFSSDGVELEDF